MSRVQAVAGRSSSDCGNGTRSSRAVETVTGSEARGWLAVSWPGAAVELPPDQTERTSAVISPMPALYSIFRTHLLSLPGGQVFSVHGTAEKALPCAVTDQRERFTTPNAVGDSDNNQGNAGWPLPKMTTSVFVGSQIHPGCRYSI